MQQSLILLRTSHGDVMRRMIYCSQATFDFSPEELISLLELAREKNQASGLTGMLLYSSQSFLQVLEGDATALAEDLSADRRRPASRRSSGC